MPHDLGPRLRREDALEREERLRRRRVAFILFFALSSLISLAGVLLVTSSYWRVFLAAFAFSLAHQLVKTLFRRRSTRP